MAGKQALADVNRYPASASDSGHGVFAVSQADEASSALPSQDRRLCQTDIAKDTPD